METSCRTAKFGSSGFDAGSEFASALHFSSSAEFPGATCTVQNEEREISAGFSEDNVIRVFIPTAP